MKNVFSALLVIAVLVMSSLALALPEKRTISDSTAVVKIVKTISDVGVIAENSATRTETAAAVLTQPRIVNAVDQYKNRRGFLRVAYVMRA